MTRKKYKPTGCARFFVVLLILIPLAYFGAKMLGGGEGIPVIDNFIESVWNKVDDGKTASPEGPPTRGADTEQLKKDNLILQKQVDDLKEENEQLKKEIDRLSRE